MLHLIWMHKQPRRLQHHVREIERSTLSNGIRVITERMPTVRSVSAGIWIGTGSRVESPAESGLSHFIEHMVFKGTETRSAEVIARSADSVGGGLDAFTSKELVSFNVKVLDEHVPTAFDVIADMVKNPLFAPEDIQKEKGVVLEELKMEQDNPEALIHEVFTGNFWKNDALGRPILGTKQTIRSFNRDSVVEFHRRQYTPENLLITAAGNLKHKDMLRLVEDRLGDLPRKPYKRIKANPQAHSPLIFRNKSGLEQVHVYMGVPGISAVHEDRYTCYVMNTILGGGMSSRLFQNIREKQGLAYSVYSELSMYRDAGSMFVYAGTSLKTAEKVIRSIMHEFRDLKENEVTEEELRRAKDHMKGSMVLGLESTSNRMANLARQELYFGKFFSMDELLEKVEAVTAEDVRKLAVRFFDSERVAVAMLGDLNGFKMSRKDLLAC